jgi:hypothetical protein
MFETLVRGGGIDKPGQGELMDVPEALKGAGVDDLPFIGAENDERMDRISKLVVLLSHAEDGSNGGRMALEVLPCVGMQLATIPSPL